MAIKRRWSLHPKDKDARIRNLLAMLQRELRRSRALRRSFHSAEVRGAITREALRRRDPMKHCHECGAENYRYDTYSGGLDCMDCGAIR